ncbi:DNA topoisomerase 3-beta [Strongyloides ratti]|uniref:DNA topoisomerase n=1 Tax=Strongyloides ratti TaxID=34506 RepID=A0A090KU15_STRRB|nr:DNA topoisomerase 3-beta [Strongyloides ratti]CEF61010.1 DNA topoisomerase 3-beta [Strongyloides ratti]
MFVTVLMVAEKPSLAKTISGILSNNTAKRIKNNENSPPQFHFKGRFKNFSANFIMTSTYGHIKETTFAKEYTDWRIDDSKLFDCPLVKLNTDKSFKIDKYFSRIFSNCDYLVLCKNIFFRLDNDREGENICFEVMDACKLSCKKTNFEDYVYRARFSALTDVHIKNSMNNLTKPNKNESDSVDALHEIDLRIGCSFTRFQTKFLKRYISKNNTIKCLSFGPCQTPTLNFCVQRHKDIKNHTSVSYWRIKLILRDNNSDIELKPRWMGENCFNEEEFKEKIKILRKNKFAQIVEVEKKNVLKNPPKALNTIELLKTCSKNLSISPSDVMLIAENLYVRGFISYPRTETSMYPIDFDFNDILNKLKSDNEWKDIIKNLLEKGICLSSQGKDKGDHPPITPVRASKGVLGGRDKEVYDVIVKNFLASIMTPCEYETYSIKLLLDDESFIYYTRRIVDLGYTVFIKDDEVSESFIPLNVKKNDFLHVVSVRSEKKTTKPLTHLTESELISFMEQNQIGTDASIAGHISNIIKRKFVTIEKGRKLVPTVLGIELINIYEKIDKCLISPQTRAETEKFLIEISTGTKSKDYVVSFILNKYKNIFEKLTSEFHRYFYLIKNAIIDVPDEKKINEKKNRKRKISCNSSILKKNESNKTIKRKK